MKIRNYQPGDETVQAEIYNEAAGNLPKFKPSSPEEIRKRFRARDFDAANRFYAESNGQVVGYCAFQPNGRISFPWCRSGHESSGQALFDQALQTMSSRGLSVAFAAYRSDWPTVLEYFLSQGFHVARDMVSLVLDEVDMPTRPGVRRNPLTPPKQSDVPAIAAMGRGIIRTRTDLELERYLFHNPYFSSEALFVVRGRTDDAPIAVGLLVADSGYANPHLLDADMPCFRLGAFGTEQMQTKRVNGLFSFLTTPGADISSTALDLLGQALEQFQDTIDGTLAAQVPSDAAELCKFYERYFRRQGSFPVLERSLG